MIEFKECITNGSVNSHVNLKKFKFKQFISQIVFLPFPNLKMNMLYWASAKKGSMLCKLKILVHNVLYTRVHYIQDSFEWQNRVRQ